MPVASIGPLNALPRSHCFFSFSYGQTIRTIRLRTGVAWTAGGTIGALALWLVGASLYLCLHDDLVASLIARAAATQYAYEDRIAALRGQVERESSLKLVGQTTLDGKLKELTARAAALEARASLLAEITTRSGLPSAGSRSAAARSAPGAVGQAGAFGTPLGGMPTGSLGPATKPHPEVEGALDDMGRPAGGGDLPSFRIRLASVEERLERIDVGQYRDLGDVQEAAHQRATALRAAIASAGLSVERVTAGAPVPALGGPFVPLDPAVLHSSFGIAVEAMQGELGTAAALSSAMPHVPLAKPLLGPLDVTSPFGARVDPFLGRPAMHTGVDLREGYGTEVRSTAAGRVVSAGPAGGYGTMIEIDHGHGLSTRYAHLSSVGVAPGQMVDQGAVIGEVGATGRATGPHLHYETRIDGEAVDPERFLMAGTRLAAMDPAL